MPFVEGGRCATSTRESRPATTVQIAREFAVRDLCARARLIHREIRRDLLLDSVSRGADFGIGARFAAACVIADTGWDASAHILQGAPSRRQVE